MTYQNPSPDWIQGAHHPWEVVIGLEVHAQIQSKSKLFSPAPTDFGAAPNTQVSLIDLGFPGMLPVLNGFCVEQIVRTGLGLNAQIHLHSVFDRKHYFYADLPAGYQITQFYHPIVGAGHVVIEKRDGTEKKIGIHHIHLEQDAGKSTHSTDYSYVDFNRAGVALMEIVTEPDMRSAEEVNLFIKKLRSILRYLGTCDGNMDEGSLRADVNVSVRPVGGDFGTRVEVKNVNSIRFMGQAIAYEVERQIALLESGGRIDQETRLFDAVSGVTRSMRDKEDARDYRYFPDPDLPPLVIEADWVSSLRAQLPELPDGRRLRFMEQFGLSAYDADILVAEQETAAFFEEAVSASQHGADRVAKLIANWMLGDFFAALNRDSLDLERAPVDAAKLAGLVDLIVTGTLSGKMAKDVFAHMWKTGETAEQVVARTGLEQVNDDGAIARVIDEVLARHQDKVSEYHQGKEKLFGFFVGQVMKAMAGQGNPERINQLLIQALQK